MVIEFVKGHKAYIMERGGRRRVGELLDLESVKWNRIRDDISDAEVNITLGPDGRNAKLVDQIETGRHELCIFRGKDRVWEGPIQLPRYTRTGLSISAKDILTYTQATVMHAAYDSSNPNIEYATSRVKRILVAELARKEALNPPYNIVPYIVEHHVSTDAKTSRSTLPYQTTVFEHMDDIAAKGGMDYTVIGRAIHLWDTSKSLGQTRVVTENDFSGDVVISVYGSELATSAISTDGQGNYAISGGIDPYYGEWERLFTAYDEETDESLPTQAELLSQAHRNRAGRLPTPLQVRVPDGASINMNGVLTLEDMVPGVHVPLLANLNTRRLSQMQKFDKIQFEETGAGETINVTMSPASKADEDDTE